MRSDKELLGDFGMGDNAAFKHLRKRYFTSFVTGTRKGGPFTKEEATRIVKQTFDYAKANIAEYDMDQSVVLWLCSIVESIAAPIAERMAVPDEKLLDRFAATGDNDAFTELHSRHAESLIKTICDRYTHDWSSAEDIVQDVFSWVSRHHAEFNRRFSFRPWLCGLAINHAIQLQQKMAA